jgi:hypothetical protein
MRIPLPSEKKEQKDKRDQEGRSREDFGGRFSERRAVSRAGSRGREATEEDREQFAAMGGPIYRVAICPIAESL